MTGFMSKREVEPYIVHSVVRWRQIGRCSVQTEEGKFCIDIKMSVTDEIGNTTQVGVTADAPIIKLHSMRTSTPEQFAVKSQ